MQKFNSQFKIQFIFFRLNYETAIATGIVAFFLKHSTEYGFGIQIMSIDFELTEKPRIAFYSRDGIPNVLQLNTEGIEKL